VIELYRTAGSAAGEEIEEAIKDLVLAHRVFIVEPGQQPVSLPPGTSLPALKDEGEIITGAGALKAHLETLAKIAFEWRKYQSDSCYIHDDGGNC